MGRFRGSWRGSERRFGGRRGGGRRSVFSCLKVKTAKLSVGEKRMEREEER